LGLGGSVGIPPRAAGQGQRLLVLELRGGAARKLQCALVVLAFALAWPSAAAAQGLFVVSQNNQKILHYDHQTGSFLSTFVAPVTQGFQTPGGMAIHPTSGVLYVASTATGEIWKYTTATGVVITPRAAGNLFGPGGVAFDATGTNLYFVDPADGLSVSTDAVKRMVVSSGAVTTLSTDATANFESVAVNGSNLYVSDNANNRIVRYPVGGGAGTVVVSGLSLPCAILFRSATDMVFADTGTDRVLEYTFNGSAWVFQRVVLPATAGVDGPCGLALAPDGRLTVAGRYSDNVVAVDLTTLAVSTLVAPGAGGLSNAKDVAWSGSTLLVASLATNSIIYYDASGVPTGVVARGLTTPSDGGMTYSPSGNLLVASMANNDLVEYDGTTGAVVRMFFDACPTSLASPFDVVYGPDGNVYVTCMGSDGVHRFSPTGTPLGFFVTGGDGGLAFPRGLAFGPDGNLYVASGFTSEILEYDGTTGAFVGVFVDSGGNGGGAVTPFGIAFHEGDLYVASYFNNEVKRFNGTTGAFVSTFVTSGSGGLSGPSAVAFGPDGDLYVTSQDDDAIRRYAGSNGAFISTFVGSGSGTLDTPVDLAFHPASFEGPENVPSLSSTGSAALLVLLGLAGARRLRGRPRAGARA
jgi:sugar lactone lactonase YvrE